MSFEGTRRLVALRSNHAARTPRPHFLVGNDFEPGQEALRTSSSRGAVETRSARMTQRKASGWIQTGPAGTRLFFSKDSWFAFVLLCKKKCPHGRPSRR